ncbi:MAG: IS1 family transposase, partial [Clostridia bacterium]|nr:IS1 family transposase [Clostridia bacterium]
KHLIGKSNTYTVERMNRLLRHYLARFARKTYCRSLSLSMISFSVSLFTFFY